MAEEKTVIDFLKKVSPGTALREVIEDLIKAGDIGGLIVFDSPELQKIKTGGFEVDCDFTSQRLFELCKMDGAVIITPDLKKIIAANVLLTPDPSISSSETGTRHQAGERTAKQAKTLVISISERRKKTTLYFSNTRYILKNIEELIRKISANLQVLEKQREIFKQIVNNLNLLELSDLVSVGDVCQAIQRAEIILQISESTKRDFIELGREGDAMRIRYRELLKDVGETEDRIIKDYSYQTIEETKNQLVSLDFENLFDIDSTAEILFKKNQKQVSPKGYRFLSATSLTDEDITQLVEEFQTLIAIIEANPDQLRPILKIRPESIKQEISTLREQILTGKEVF